MKNTEKYEGLELLQKLCGIFGPTGCEDAVAEFICGQIDGDCDAYCIDKVGNVIAKLCGRGKEYEEAETHKNIMISSHMDEVGFMVDDIDDEGYLKFKCVGGIDPSVLCGRHVVLGDELSDTRIKGIIASKAIHLQTREEREKLTPVNKMYIDIGALNKEDALKYVSIGTWGTFDSDFVYFGHDNEYIKSKAIDDRLGCAAMIEVMRELKNSNRDNPYDIYFTFTRCEEIGISTATVAAQVISPEIAIILESTAIGDVPGSAPNSTVAKVGEGGVISLVDRSTIYDRGLIDICLSTAELKNIPVQIKKYVSGGNDAGHIHKSGAGVRSLAISAPTRYLHSPSCVIAKKDYFSIRDLLCATLNKFNTKN